MKKVEAIIRSEKLKDFKEAMVLGGYTQGMTINKVLGHGKQKGFKGEEVGSGKVPTLLSKVKVEIIVADEDVEELIDTVIWSVKTGKVGDGKIFVSSIDDVIRIRTGERGPDAL